MSYDKIINPKTGKKVSIYGKSGANIISSYYNFLIKKDNSLQKGGADDANTVINAVTDGVDNGAVEEICDARYVFDNFWRTKEAAEYFRSLNIYTENEAEEHLSFKTVLDSIIDNAISIDTQSEKTQGFYLEVIDYLVKKCPNRKMKLYERTSEEDERRDPAEFIVEYTSNVTDTVAHLKTIIGNRDINKVHLLMEPRAVHNGEYPFKSLALLLESFTNITHSLGA